MNENRQLSVHLWSVIQSQPQQFQNATLQAPENVTDFLIGIKRENDGQTLCTENLPAHLTHKQVRRQMVVGILRVNNLTLHESLAWDAKGWLHTCYVL